MIATQFFRRSPPVTVQLVLPELPHSPFGMFQLPPSLSSEVGRDRRGSGADRGDQLEFAFPLFSGSGDSGDVHDDMDERLDTLYSDELPFGDAAVDNNAEFDFNEGLSFSFGLSDQYKGLFGSMKDPAGNGKLPSSVCSAL